MMPAGLWYRPAYYGTHGATAMQAIREEVATSATMSA